MKAINWILVVVLAIALPCGSAWAEKKGRKLPADVYLRTAKIDIVEGRHDSAIVHLNSLLSHYGPHSEGLYLMGQIMVDLVETTGSPKDKAPYVEKMVAYFDSLQMCCADKEIKKSYRKNCKKYSAIADSAMGKYWHQFYIAGRENLQAAEELGEQLESETDSTTRAYIENDMSAKVNSSIENMKLSITIIPDSSQTYLALGKAYELKEDYQSAIESFQKGLEKSTERSSLLLSIAYDYIKLDQYCEAIPYYKEHVELAPEDVRNMLNLSICYNDCDMYDSALGVYHKILAVEPENVGVVTNVGLFYNTMARFASDSASKYQQEENNELAATWRNTRQDAFDSSRTYFRRAFELKPDDAYIAEQYGIVCALSDDYEEAIIGFAKLAQLEPELSDSWTSLGDCYLTLKQFDDAISAYEKVVELEPDNIRVWEHLKDLYFETGRKGKLAEAKKKLNELKQ